jgi:hypothetical protein
MHWQHTKHRDGKISYPLNSRLTRSAFVRTNVVFDKLVQNLINLVQLVLASGSAHSRSTHLRLVAAGRAEPEPSTAILVP